MRRVAFAIPLLAACATTSPIPPAATPALPPGAWVELRFAWNPGLAIEMETTHGRSTHVPTASDDEEPDRAEVQVRSHLAVDATPAGLVVKTRDLSHAGPAKPSFEGVEILALELAAPDRVIGRAGNLIGVEAREDARADVGEALASLSRVGPMPAAYRDLVLRERLEPPALWADAAAEWDRLVGFWAGASLQVGQTYVARDLIPFDLLAGLPIEVEVRMRLVDRVPCVAGEAELRCVALELVIASDDDAAIARVPRFLAGLEGQPLPTASSLAYEERTLLVTEPDGLVPHRLVTTKTLALALGPEGANRRERIDERMVQFTYPASPPSR